MNTIKSVTSVTAKVLNLKESPTKMHYTLTLAAAFKIVSKGMITMSRSDNGVPISYLADMDDILVWMREAIRGMINDTFVKLAPILCENTI